MTDAQLRRLLVNNAIDFLERAIEEFKDRPKYSIINFYAAVELFLKARLLREHWSLVVLREPDRQKFEAGDFVSVSFEAACERLQRVVQSPIPDEARRNFDVVRKHRNRMVHFFHEADQGGGADISTIAREQLRAWYHLHRLLTVQWKGIFRRYNAQFIQIEKKLGGHKEYLRAKFEELGPEIAKKKESGVSFVVCNTCGFLAGEIEPIIGQLNETRCLVCGFSQKWLNYACPDCEHDVRLFDGGEFTCPECGYHEDARALAENLNQFVATKDNYMDAIVPANCTECESYHSIVEYEDKYLCVVCFDVADRLEACGWCNEFSNGDMEDSYLTGCSICAGAAGWHAERDD